jgi:glycosyltransferase involved in cell wall biosynthesis
MKLSVVVCTFQRYDALANCLDALRHSTQTAPAKAYEVIVVDNTSKAARRSKRGFHSDKWIICDEVGLSNARNTGVAAAEGDIIAFIDDDALPVLKWCEEVIAVFDRHPAALVVGGKTVPEYPDGRGPAWMTSELAQYLSCIDWGDEEHVLHEDEWIVGANMAFRRNVFDGTPLFDPGLGRKGNLGLLSNEEITLIRRIGHQHVVYDPGMLIRHVIPRDRLTQTWFRKRVFWQAMSDQLAGIGVPTSTSAWEEIRRIIPRLPAERRTLNGLSAKCASAEEFTIQLRQLSLITHLMASGMAAE